MVTTAPGFREAYRDWAAGRLERAHRAPRNSAARACRCCSPRLRRDVELGQHGLQPRPAAHLRRRSRRSTAHGSDELKDLYLAKLVSGEWTGTMNLTEPQAGSDLRRLRTRAERAGDGTYRITGQKIFITYGEHDLTDNIIHLVLARLPDAPAGTRGISLFLVPKFLVGATARSASATTCAATRSSTSSASTPRRPAPWSIGDKGGANGLPDRRGEPRPRLHVHHDEQRAARCRRAGRGDRRARDAAGARLCAGAPPGPRAGPARAAA